MKLSDVTLRRLSPVKSDILKVFWEAIVIEYTWNCRRNASLFLQALQVATTD